MFKYRCHWQLALHRQQIVEYVEYAKHEPVNTFERSLHAGGSGQRAISKKGALSSILQDRNSQDLLFGSAEAAPFQDKALSPSFLHASTYFPPCFALNTCTYTGTYVCRVFQGFSLQALFKFHE